MDATVTHSTLNLDDLVATRLQPTVTVDGVEYEYADVETMGAYKRQRLNWLWRQVLAFETAEEPPTEISATRYEAHVDELMEMVLPSIDERVRASLPWYGKTGFLLDFFNMQGVRNREIQTWVSSRTTGGEPLPRFSGSTARRPRKSG